MNYVFFLLVAIAYGTVVWHQWHASLSPAAVSMHGLTDQLLQAASDAVTLGIGLVGVLGLFLGLMKILEEGGLLQSLANLISPLLKWLFPEIPRNHPAFGAMAMNLSANLIGLGNAATPFGLKAMEELNKLNPHPGVATNAMVLFLAINTSSVTLLPTKIIALRVSAGSQDPTGVIATTLFATLCSTVIAILAAKLLQRWVKTPAPTLSLPPIDEDKTLEGTSQWASLLMLGCVLALIPITVMWGKLFSAWIIPSLIVGILAYGLWKKVDIYATFVEGAKGGLDIAFRIIPYLIAILMAIGMFRASGALDAFSRWIGPYTTAWGLPPEAIPMVFMRPLSGSGSLGILSDILNNPAIGPDSYIGYLVSTMMGSTETTFYILAVYFGAIQIKRIRHAMAAGLIADAAGMIASIMAVKIFLFS